MTGHKKYILQNPRSQNFFPLNNGDVCGGGFVLQKYTQRFDLRMSVPVSVHAQRRINFKGNNTV
jgi:hypothetical protein